MTRFLGSACVVLAAACGSASAPATSAPVAAVPQAAEPAALDLDGDERARRDRLAAAHRKLEEEQQEALAATCTEPEPREKRERCLPSCYPNEPPDPRAGKRLPGVVEVVHLVCELPGGSGRYALADEVLGAGVALRAVRGRYPAAHKVGTWQQAVETALADQRRPPLPRGDLIVVAGGWRELEHPLTRERLRCVTALHYTRRMRRALDGCGGDGALACEATGDPAARGLNVVHFRVAEASRLQAAGKLTDCQQAALEAVAIARGLARWRQYVKLNVRKWVDRAGYRTRFDGILDEDALFATAAGLGGDAERIHAACGGPAGAPTTAAQEQSFHTCW